jgi:hypothetical protein
MAKLLVCVQIDWSIWLEFHEQWLDTLGIKFEDKVGLGGPTENPYGSCCHSWIEHLITPNNQTLFEYRCTSIVPCAIQFPCQDLYTWGVRSVRPVTIEVTDRHVRGVVPSSLDPHIA